jgi:hypothetical protein
MKQFPTRVYRMERVLAEAAVRLTTYEKAARLCLKKVAFPSAREAGATGLYAGESR